MSISNIIVFLIAGGFTFEAFSILQLGTTSIHQVYGGIMAIGAGIIWAIAFLIFRLDTNAKR